MTYFRAKMRASSYRNNTTKKITVVYYSTSAWSQYILYVDLFRVDNVEQLHRLLVHGEY